MKRIILLLFACFSLIGAHAAYLRNVPKTLTQPDGTVLHCYASGDEFFNYLHDANGFTIMQHPQTGFYVYADKRDGNLVATEYVAGRVDPASKNLRPFNLISPQEWMARRRAWEVHDERPQNRDYTPNHGTLNNISIFIRFSDDTEFTNSYYDIDNMFNDESENAISLKTYFRAASYNAIEIPTTFYPGHNGDVVISYQDTYPRSYFEPYNESTNPNGYQNDNESREREFSLLERAVNYINANYPVPTNLNIDYDNDGLVDNVCFIVRGDVGEWSSLLWPHKWALYDRTVRINGKRVYTFNFQLADATGYFNTSTMCHEMNHSLGAPDLYHYSYSGPSPVGPWDLMENNANPPQHCGAYMKMKYGHWIDEIPEITQAGVYTLNPISSATPTNVAYKIQSEDPNQYYVLEYRDKTSLFETSLPGSGLLIYRIDTRFDGNASYNPSNGIYDEVYLFRPGGSTSTNGTLSSAHFSSDVGRTEFCSSTSAYPFFTDGTIDNNFRIYNITSAGNTISFSYGTSSDCNPPTHLVATLEDNNVSLSWDAAANAVSYNIYRGGTLIGNTSGTTYTDSNIAYGIYNYFLKSVDANGLYSTSSETVTVEFLPEGAVFIGDGNSATNDLLPSYSYYKYALTQQIYTAAELGESGLITSIAFYNAGAAKTRTYDFYLKHTTKSAFTGVSDWEVVTTADKVFSGSVTMAADAWTIITFDTPFSYDGTSNLVLVADDNTGTYTGSPHMSCRVFNASSKTLRVYSDDTNYDPIAPESYSGTVVMDVKNQLLITKVIPSSDIFNVTVSANPEEGGFVTIGRLFFDFEDGTSQGWTYLKGSNGTSPNNWMHCVDYTPRDYTSGYGHEYSDGFMLSESYISGMGEGEGTPVYPDNYLVSPQVLLGGSIHFWATNPNDSYGEEHFAIAVSTNSNTNIDDFTQVQEWTLQPTGKAERTGNTRTNTNGIWYEYTADLSAFSGLGYVAIHHFDCYDQWLLCIDDITITGGTLDGGRNISSAFNYGESCTVLAMSAEGYYFKNWTIDNVEVSREASYTFIVTGETDLVANFVEGYLIGDGGDATNVNLPSYNFFNYGLSQQIYTAEELGEEGLITSIAFYNAGAEKTRTYDFYMKATEKASFAGANDWETVTDMDKVFSGEVTMVVDDWTFITLYTPFFYDGTSNVVLVTDDNTGTYTNSPHMACRVFDADSQSIYVRSDGTNYDPSTLSLYNGTVLSVKNQLRFTKEPFGDCMPPIHLLATEVGPDFAVLSWTEIGTATEWVVVCGDNTVTADTNEGFVLEGLDPETEYTIVVHPSCDETLSSNIITITTLDACPVPQHVEVSNITGNAATVTWTGYDDSYNVQIGITSLLLGESFNNGIPTGWDNSSDYPWTIVDGYMQSGNGGVANSTSSISVTVTFTTDGTVEFDAECLGEGTSTYWDHCDFYIDDSRALYIGAGVSGWNHYSFDVAAGEHTFTWSYTKDNSVNPVGDHFAVDNVMMGRNETVWNDPVAVEDAEYTFSGLNAETTYFVKVQGVCNGTETEWSVPVMFTTAETTTITQTIELTSGWNYVSTYIDMNQVDGMAMLKEALGDYGVTIVTFDDQAEYLGEGFWLGLEDYQLTNGEMILVEVSEDCTLTLEGPVVDPSTVEITINPEWNYIGYPLAVEMTVEEAMSAFEAEFGDGIANFEGLTEYLGEWMGDFETLVPGQGYMYYSYSDVPKTFVFSTGSKAKAKNASQKVKPICNQKPDNRIKE